MAVYRPNEISRSNLRATIREMNEKNEKYPIKTAAGSAQVRPEFVGHDIDLFNGQRYVRIHITNDMIDRKLKACLPKETVARLEYVSIPPRKMRLVANLIKDMPIQKALDILNFTKRAAAPLIAKTLKSAAANAMSLEGTSHIRAEDLHVKSIEVDPAPSAKRIRFQSMGRVFRYRKRHSHLMIVLEERSAVAAPAPVTGREKTKSAAEGDAAEATDKKATPKKAKSTPRKAARKGAAKKGAKKVAAKPKKKTAPTKKSKSSK